nr:helix-turn-helix domain-containing protein [uncultured Agathobaculum sp.]
MKQPTFCGRELLPLSVIEAARASDCLAVERVLRYYEGYINKICTRTLYGKDGLPHIDIDEYMKHRLQAKLVEAIVVRK